MHCISEREFNNWKNSNLYTTMEIPLPDGSIALFAKSEREFNIFHFQPMMCKRFENEPEFKLYEVRSHITRVGFNGQFSYGKKELLDLLHFYEFPSHQVTAYIDEYNTIYA